MTYRKLIDSQYGQHPDNFHLARDDKTLIVELTYPPWTDAENKHGQVRHVQINQEAVRASDGIRVHYDYDRDGFVVEQPKFHMVDRDGCSEEMREGIEVGFFQSWAFGCPGDEAIEPFDHSVFNVGCTHDWDFETDKCLRCGAKYKWRVE